MLERRFSSILLTVVLVFSVFSVEPVGAVWTGGKIYIRADGRIEPANAPITTRDGVTYTLTDDVTTEGIVIERDNIILEGNEHKVAGRGWGGGIRLENRRNVVVRNLKIEKFYYGIYLIESSNITITRNTISNNSRGIALYDSSGNTISGNTITSNNDDGIYLWYSSGNRIVGNTIANNRRYGIYLEYSSGNRIVGNTIAKNDYGIYLWWFSKGNTVAGNTIAKNDYGIYLEYSSGNRVFLNNFIGNYRQVSSKDSVNVWDNGSRGNFWSDYKGSDVNNDGVGDTPYTIDEKNVDRYPSIHPYEGFPVEITSLYGTTSGEGWYMKGATVTISVSPVFLDYGNGTRRVFSGWYDEKGVLLSREPVFSLTVEKPFSITAKWDTDYKVEVYSPYGSAVGSNWYEKGSVAIVSVSPAIVDAGFFVEYVFEGWVVEGRLVSASPEHSFTVDRPVTLTARWVGRVKLANVLALLILAMLAVGLLVWGSRLPTRVGGEARVVERVASEEVETRVAELERLRVLEVELEKVKGYLSRLEEEWKKGTVSSRVYEILKKEYQAKIEQLESEVKKVKERREQG
ncbi:MAG: NosD domain-containing protein [Thermofilaceae archaeon]